MDKNNFSRPLELSAVQVTDEFWKKETELVRTQVLPYQWKALNDQVEGAEPSFCMHNFRAAARQNQERREKGSSFQEPSYTERGFQCLPEDMAHPEEDKFYGFVFQDSDLYKWIEAAAYSLAQHPDEELEKTADEAIDLICSAQQENGYLDTYYILNGMERAFTNLRDNHELYCLGHLAEAAVAYYQTTGKRKLLDAACRYADYAARCLGPGEGQRRGYPGHEIAEMALIRLYEVTKEERYLELARFFLDERGQKPSYFDLEHPEQKGDTHEYMQAHLPIREQEEATGHAVRAVYLYSGMADAARAAGDEGLWEACRKLWDNATEQKLYITGGIGGTHIGEAFSFGYDLPNDTAYAETCASVGLVFWARRMLQIHPEAKYGDVMELALYNNVLSGMALDGQSFFYVNPLEVFPEACHRDARKWHVKPVRQKWFGCACCPPNIARLLGSVGSYAFTEREDTLFVHLYIGCDVKKQIHGKEGNIHIHSGFPWDGKVEISVDGPGGQDEDGLFTLALRIPGWGQAYTLQGAERLKKETRDGYLYLTGKCKDMKELVLEFPMEPRLVQANSRVREDAGKAALMRGPITYCLEEADNGKDLHLLSVKWDACASPEAFTIQGNQVTALRMKGLRQRVSESTALYEAARKPQKEEVTLRFVPYYTWANRGENEMTVWVLAE